MDSVSKDQKMVADRLLEDERVLYKSSIIQNWKCDTQAA